MEEMNIQELKKNNQIVQESQVVPSIVKMNYYLLEPERIKDLYRMEQAIVEDIIIMKKKVQDTQEGLLKDNIRMNEEMKKANSSSFDWFEEEEM
mgnify:CR=1 FL=1